MVLIWGALLTYASTGFFSYFQLILILQVGYFLFKDCFLFRVSFLYGATCLLIEIIELEWGLPFGMEEWEAEVRHSETFYEQKERIFMDVQWLILYVKINSSYMKLTSYFCLQTPSQNHTQKYPLYPPLPL